MYFVNETFPPSIISNGCTFSIDKNVLTSSYKTCDCGRVCSNYCRVLKQVLSEILTDDVSPLKVDLLEQEKNDNKSKKNAQIQIRPISIEVDPIKRMLDEYPGTQFSLFLEYYPQRPHAKDEYTYFEFEEMHIDRLNHVYTFPKPVRMYLENLISDWQVSGTVNFKLETRFPDELIFPSAYLEELDNDNQINDKAPVEIAFPAFRTMLEEGTHSDTTILAKNGAEIRCHRAILAGCNHVFHAMFQSGLRESQTGQVDMTDMSEGGVWALLRYLYYGDKGVVNANTEVVFDVLYAAHKYDMPRLQAEMIECLLEKNESEFPLDLTLFIYMFARGIKQAFQLRMKTARIMNSKWSVVENLPDFIELSQNCPEVVHKLHEDLARSTM